MAKIILNRMRGVEGLMWDVCIGLFLLSAVIIAIAKGWWRSALEILFPGI